MRFHHSKNASVLLLAVGWIAVLAVLTGLALSKLQNRSRQAFQTASWQEALLAAESGIDLAVQELRRSLRDPSSAWNGWQHADGTVGNPEGGTVFLTSNTLLRQGEGGNRSWVRVEVDAPASMRSASGEQWYRVRSHGYAEIPGGSVAIGTNEDIQLRKLDFRTDHRTGESITSPRASRVVEAIIKPVGAFRVPLLGDIRVDMNNLNIVVDSYDSEDDTKSTNGFYDPSKRQENGHVATNGLVVDAGNSHIYGDVMTNGGVALNTSNVTGEIRDDFYMELFPVIRPTMTPTLGTPATVTGNTVIQANAGSPTHVVLSTISLSGQNTLRIQGAADGSETFVQILVNGNISLSGQAQIILDPGVYARMFVVGDADVTGNGVSNPNSPLHFQFYGVERISGDPNGTMKIAGNGGFRGTVYAPNYEVEMVGGGNSDSIYGAFVGRTIRMTGVQSVHYDEQLGSGGLISDYKIVSWFEDNR